MVWGATAFFWVVNPEIIQFSPCYKVREWVSECTVISSSSHHHHLISYYPSCLIINRFSPYSLSRLLPFSLPSLFSFPLLTSLSLPRSSPLSSFSLVLFGIYMDRFHVCRLRLCFSFVSPRDQLRLTATLLLPKQSVSVLSGTYFSR